MKKILLITYYWPPCGGPGSIRPLKFAKYLPEFGLEPIVLTRKNIAYHSIDNGLSRGLRATVHRTESFDPARILYLLGLREYHPKKWQIPIKRVMNFPDNKIGWIPFAYPGGIKIDFDYIFVTGPPFSAFITGYILNKRTSKPLILDFRDAWLEFPFLRYGERIQKKFVLFWEKRVVKSSALIITISEDIKNRLIMRYPEIEGKTFVIPNGYDPDDFQSFSYPEKFTLSYLGTIRKERNPESILNATDRFIQMAGLKEGEIEVKFIGYIEEPFLMVIKKYPYTKVFGHLPYSRAIEEFCSAHLAFITTTGDDFFFPSRQNEYLASGLPVICCGKSKGIHILSESVSRGYPCWIYDWEDINGMAAKILEIYKQYIKGKIKRAEIPFPEYTRRNLAKKLAELIKEKI